ncbi:MAG: hypothetical protein U0V72_11215 [Cytophagales bacterium]
MFSLFKAFQTKKIDSHFANLLAVTKLDGTVSEEEISYLYKAGQKFGYSEADVNDFLNNNDVQEPQIPETREERIEQVLDLLELIGINKVVTEEELEFVTNYAYKLGAKSEFTDIIIRKMAMELLQDKTREEVKTAITPFLVY